MTMLETGAVRTWWCDLCGHETPEMLITTLYRQHGPSLLDADICPSCIEGRSLLCLYRRLFPEKARLLLAPSRPADEAPRRDLDQEERGERHEHVPAEHDYVQKAHVLNGAIGAAD